MTAWDANHSHDCPTVTFFRIIEQAPLPMRADRSAAGTLPARAARYCDAVSTASAFGWWLFPPIDFSLLWDGRDIFWSTGDAWWPLGTAQVPDQSARFDAVAPADLTGCSPPFLTALPEPGGVQIWTGMLARTAPDWSLLVRALANLPTRGGFILYEGIVETDRWLGPIFTNLRLTRTDYPVHFRVDFPLLQVQPLPRKVYTDTILQKALIVPKPAAINAAEWQAFKESIITSKDYTKQTQGAYAVSARRRRRELQDTNNI